jgi:hypothetical protein
VVPWLDADQGADDQDENDDDSLVEVLDLDGRQ